MKFVTEYGAVVNDREELINLIPGTPAEVDFPTEYLWKLHQLQPGSVFKLVHTHPPKMTELSQIDQKTLRRLSVILHPFPARLATVTLIEEANYKPALFLETVYAAFLEPRVTWQERKKVDTETRRGYEVLVVEKNEIEIPSDYTPVWANTIITRSYIPAHG